MQEEEIGRNPKDKRLFTRRDFIKGVAAGAAVLTAIPSLPALTAVDAKVATPMGVTGLKTEETAAEVTSTGFMEPVPSKLVTLTINGDPYSMDIKANWTLAQVLRDKLGLTGAKLMCDEGSCGACAVIMDGKAVLSCLTLAIEAEGHEIETPEGIAAAKHPVIQAFADAKTIQCGMCAPGIAVASKALLDSNPNPTEEEAAVALSGHICKCGTYAAWPGAVLDAASKL
jgi:carbon-monoxide dehydrogenase small subunit